MKPRIKDLHAANVSDKPRDYDFFEGYGEKWECWEADECDTCGKILLSLGGENHHNDINPDSKCEGYIHTEGPMMNYCYPVSLYQFDNDPNEAAKAIARLPLCIVQFTDEFSIGSEDEYYLALTGGGMDFSWEICEAYMRLGQLPPLHFCHLPGMAGRGQNRHDKWIIAGCRASTKALRNQAYSTIRHLATVGKR